MVNMAAPIGGIKRACGRSEAYLVEPRVNPYNGALKPQYRYYGRR